MEDNGQANETQDFDETIIYAFGDVSIKIIGYNQKLLHDLGLIYASPATVGGKNTHNTTKNKVHIVYFFKLVICPVVRVLPLESLI